MKSKLLLAAIVLSLAACTQPASDTATPVAPAAVADAPAKKGSKADCPPAISGYQVLPKGVNLGVPFHLRSDRIYTHKSGKLRRKVVLEFLEGDAAAALAAVQKSFNAAKFTVDAVKAGDNGRNSVTFTRKGYGVAIVGVSPEIAQNPSHPQAKGVITLDIPND